MTGAGHGIFIPVLILWSQAWTILLPFLIGGANTPWKRVRIIAKALVCVYYVWLLFHFNALSYLPDEYHRIARTGEPGIFWMWASLVLLTHCLIWLPVPVIRVYRKHFAKRPDLNA